MGICYIDKNTYKQGYTYINLNIIEILYFRKDQEVNQARNAIKRDKGHVQNGLILS